MIDTIDQRFATLVADGKRLVSQAPESHWMPDHSDTECHKWLTGCANLIGIATGTRGVYWEQATKVLSHPDLASGVPTECIRRMHGILESTRRDWTDGLLKEIEYVVAATTFDDFLDHAIDFHKANKKVESAVLVSVVLEDSIKKIARKHSIDSNRSLDPIIDDLVTKQTFNAVRAKRVKGYVGLRNKALHAQWDDFDIKDVGETIQGVRSLIDEFL